MSDPVKPVGSTPRTLSDEPSVGSGVDETMLPRLTQPPVVGVAAKSGVVDTLGPYKLLELLGRGGMGAVYLALDTRLGRKVALKVMNPESAAEFAAKERFVREARTAAQITHDNVVTIYEADEYDGVPFIAMQLLQGYPLDDYLKKKGELSIPQVLRLASEVAAGLSAAHEIGLVHRDIKPGNLWLEAPHGRIKILDFGLAKPLNADSELTKRGTTIGTPGYMPPEQARGQIVDHRADLFALGATLYRLCTGMLPFPGDNVMAVLMALANDEPTPVREHNPKLPEALAELIHQLLAKKPDDRPQNAAIVGERIRAIAEQEAKGTTAAADAKTSIVEVPIPITGTPDNRAKANTPANREKANESELKFWPTAMTESTPQEQKGGGAGLWVTAVLAGLLIGLALIAANMLLKDRNGPGTTGKGTNDPHGGLTGIASTPEQEAVAWVLSKGGRVTARNAEGHRDIRTLGDLPVGPYVLDVKFPPSPTDISEGLAKFAEITSPFSLDLSGLPMQYKDLVQLERCPNLRVMDLRGTTISLGEAKVFHSKLPQCTILHTDGTIQPAKK